MRNLFIDVSEKIGRCGDKDRDEEGIIDYFRDKLATSCVDRKFLI